MYYSHLELQMQLFIYLRWIIQKSYQLFKVDCLKEIFICLTVPLIAYVITITIPCYQVPSLAIEYMSAKKYTLLPILSCNLAMSNSTIASKDRLPIGDIKLPQPSPLFSFTAPLTSTTPYPFLITGPYLSLCQPSSPSLSRPSCANSSPHQTHPLCAVLALPQCPFPRQPTTLNHNSANPSSFSVSPLPPVHYPSHPLSPITGPSLLLHPPIPHLDPSQGKSELGRKWKRAII